jgi:hypothetical protein
MNSRAAESFNRDWVFDAEKELRKAVGLLKSEVEYWKRRCLDTEQELINLKEEKAKCKSVN